MGKRFQTRYFPVAMVMLLCLALITFVLPHFPDEIFTLPLWAFVLGEYLFALFISIGVEIKLYKQPISQLKLIPGLISLGLIFLVLALAVIISPNNAASIEGYISIGLLQLTAINLTILFSIFILRKSTHPSAEAKISTPEKEVSTVATSTNIKRLTQIRVKAVKGLSDTNPNMEALSSLSYQGLRPRDSKAAQAKTWDKLPAVDTDTDVITSENEIVVIKDQVRSSTGNMPEAKGKKRHENKKAGGIFSSKLQGLSTQRGKVDALQAAGETPLGLKSVLDRLDVNTQDSPVIEENDSVTRPQTALYSSTDALFSENDLDHASTQTSENLVLESNELYNISSESDEQIEQSFTASEDSRERFNASIDNGQNQTVWVKSQSIFKESVDNEMDDAFAKIAPNAESEYRYKQDFVPQAFDQSNNQVSISQTDTGDRPVLLPEPETQDREKSFTREIKDFGRLSSKAGMKDQDLSQSGRMKNIGKLLIDSKSIEQIIKKGQSGKITVNLPSAKVISQRRGEGIQSLLQAIDNYESVDGSMLVGADGFVIASTYEDIVDREVTGVLSHSMIGNTNVLTRKLELGNLKQMILTSKHSEAEISTIFTDIEAGVLAVFLNEKLMAGLEMMLDTINTVAG